MAILNKISKILAWPLLVVVLFYQKTLSPDHGLLKPLFPYGYCKFHPTCSEYTTTVLRVQGLIGIPKILKRLVSCNPWSMGGIDRPYHG